MAARGGGGHFILGVLVGVGGVWAYHKVTGK